MLNQHSIIVLLGIILALVSFEVCKHDLDLQSDQKEYKRLVLNIHNFNSSMTNATIYLDEGMKNLTEKVAKLNQDMGKIDQSKLNNKQKLDI